jgi:NurA-like 5'-3' nuclease
LFLAFQRILDHPNRSSDKKVMIKIQTTVQQTRLHMGRAEIHTTRMLHTRKFEQSWQYLSNWMASHIRPFQVSLWNILDALAAILKRENEPLKFGRDLASQGAKFKDLHVELKPSSKRSSESLNLILSSLLLVLCALLLLWISVIGS